MIKIKKNILAAFFVFGFILLNAAGTGNAVTKEAAARLYYSISSEKGKWFDGYSKYISGSVSPYQSHRSGANRDSAIVARTSGSEETAEWYTAPVTIKSNTDSVRFIWVCGFGNNLGKGFYDLTVNDQNTISFATVNQTSWQIKEANGIGLAFTAVSKNANGANLGYMVVTLPKNMIRDGQSQKIKITGRRADREIWYRVFTYTDVLDYINKYERKEAYCDLDFVYMGDAKLNIIASNKLAGLPVKILTGERLIADGMLHTSGDMAGVVITLPRSLQPCSNETSAVKIADKAVDTIYWEKINKKRLLAFMNEELFCEKYVFQPGSFPEFRWRNEQQVENEIGTALLAVKYYNADFVECAQADKHGRYGAVIEAITAAGFKIKRYVTLFCTKTEFDDYSFNVPVKINELRDYNIDNKKWEMYSANEERYSFGALKMFPQNNADAAVFLAGLNELDSSDSKLNTPRIKDRKWWLVLKQKLDNYPLPILLPQSENLKIENISSADMVKTESKNYKKEKIEKIRNVCRSWADTGSVANVTLVAHKGKIIFHEAFGVDEKGERVTTDSKMWMASITKLLTGALVMRFADKGIIDLDAPVSSYLKEMGNETNKALTVRSLLTHTSGLQITGEWANDWNYSLENQLAQLLPVVETGKEFVYHRAGYALTGKILERISGMTIPELFNHYIFTPLGMKSAYADNTYGGLYCTAADLAKLAQALLNKGKYNDARLFSENTFAGMLPKKLAVGGRYWGIGTARMDGHGLSESTFGHGAASGAVLRIDPVNELIIISARNRPGAMHDDYENMLVDACVDLIK